MKKFIGLVLAAALGGMMSVGIYTSIESNKSVATQLIQQHKSLQDNVKPVSFPTVTAETAIDFTSAAKRATNAVVNVKTTFMTETGSYYSWDPFRQFFYGDMGQYHKHMQEQLASGSGVIISTDGFIVTNNHVVKDAEKIQVTLSDGNKYNAELIGTDPTTDVALLKIDATNLPIIPYGNSDDAQVGQWVLAVGNPFNLMSTVTAGIISAKGRNINLLKNNQKDGLPAIESFIQTDAAVNPGNSGGALVATTGELIGINTAIQSNTGSYTGYSFAIPVNIVKKVVDDLLEFGQVQRGFIGVQIQNITSEFAKDNGIESLRGVYVAGISDGGAASEAGIEEGDIITKIGNVDVNEVPELQEQVSKFRPGDKIVITVKRDGVEKEMSILLKNKFGNTDLVKKENPKISAILGAHFATVSDAEMRKLQIDHGLKVTSINGGKLRSAGIQEGFVITRIDKKPINNFDDLVASLKNKNGGILIEGVYPNGMKAYYGFGM